MRKQMFFENRITLGLLLLVSFLILGTIPFALGATNDINITGMINPNIKWIINTNNNETVVNHDINNCLTSLGKLDWQSVSISADKIADDSQKAIDVSNSYEVSSDFQSVKDEYNLAMEQAIQAAIYIKKGAEEAEKGNRDGMDSNFNQAAECLKSYNQHTHSVYDQEVIYVNGWHEGDMSIIAGTGDNTLVIVHKKQT
jgi:hypothetical protein